MAHRKAKGFIEGILAVTLSILLPLFLSRAVSIPRGQRWATIPFWLLMILFAATAILKA